MALFDRGGPPAGWLGGRLLLHRPVRCEYTETDQTLIMHWNGTRWSLR